ncbi:MAG: bifunctional folylpolyglutamate synthase/dihydrofolate synthase, partial [candidate division WOR-3 bacterium]|nr:bifunctional folylpolyglutamate synthase/dihydrofolate synthase [candidate division WOR-3 bacterium]
MAPNTINPYKFLDSLINYERQTSPYYDFKLDKFIRFLKSLGSPQKDLSNVIIIAGTKGKGSTATFLESALSSCGLKTALYTSPHIISVRERIKFCGKDIPEKDFVRLIKKIQVKAKRFKITFFEAITAIAFLYFQEKKPDYIILEVGLGGRLDATNVTKPLVAVITRIGYDHTNILGKTLGKIAYEKAGIIHPGSYVVLSAQRPSALKVLLKKIRETRCQYGQADKAIKITKIKTDLSGSSFFVKLPKQKKSIFCRIKLIGRHQIENVRTALCVLNYLKIYDHRINITGVRKGLRNAKIPCRIQIVSKKPLIILDGAHNPESMQALAEVVKNILKRKVIFIFGSSQGKLIKEMFKAIIPTAQSIILTQSQNPRHIPVSELIDKIKQFNISYKTTLTVSSAIKEAMQQNTDNRPIIITGSFYVASEAQQFFQKQY